MVLTELTVDDFSNLAVPLLSESDRLLIHSVSPDAEFQGIQEEWVWDWLNKSLATTQEKVSLSPVVLPSPPKVESQKSDHKDYDPFAQSDDYDPLK